MLKTSVLLVLLVAIGCASKDHPADNQNRAAKPKRDAAIDSPPADAPSGPSVSCYSSGNPTQVCYLASGFCCFDNFVVPHNGECVASTCGHSDEHCDGPQQCTSGATCFASEWRDTSDMLHWSMACATTAPTTINGQAVITTEIMCHTNADCATGKTCQYAVNDFPTTLLVCR